MANSADAYPAIAAGDIRVIPIESRKSVEIDLALLLSEGMIRIFPRVEEMGLAFIQFRKSKASVSVGPYIGFIPLTPTTWLNIQPRLPVANLSRVLDIAMRNLTALSPISRAYRLEDMQSTSVLGFLLGNLIKSIQDLEREGFLKEYVERLSYGSHPKGRIDMPGTMWSRYVEGRPHLIASRYYQQTSDTAYNRVIRGALEYGIGCLRRISGFGTQTIKDAGAALQRLPNAIGRIKDSDISSAERAISGNRLPSARAYYHRAIEAAILILRGKGIALEELGAEVPLDTFVVNFETMFEDYLRNAIKANCSNLYEVEKDSAKKPLFDDGQRLAEPDIVISETTSRRRLVVEVKYKEKPDRDDINQTITYALSYKTRDAVLLHLAKKPKVGLYTIGVIGGIKIHGYAYDLGSTALEDQELDLVSAMKALFSPTVYDDPVAV